jgi:hypothetical protein
MLELQGHEPAGLRTKTIGVYAVLLTANVLAWLWVLAEFRDYPVLPRLKTGYFGVAADGLNSFSPFIW